MTDEELQIDHVVWKFPADDSYIDVPTGTKFLKAALQNTQNMKDLMLWGRVPNRNCGTQERVGVTVYGTGNSVPATAIYIDTFFMGPFVWHVFETGRKAIDEAGNEVESE